jgi:N6-adenosine-specific RNA methylase IME4
MANVGRPRIHPDSQTRWRLAQRHHRHPQVHYVLAAPGPGRYVTDFASLLAAGERFGCIVADPPWPYANQGTRGSTQHHYESLSVEAICALPVADLALPQCHLHLWTTSAFLFTCPQIFAAWGFEHKAELIWEKPTMGLGNYWRLAHEICLLGVRGGLTAQHKNLISWVKARRGRHSAKPNIIRDRIEQISPGPYLELFGRAAVPGWTVFGNEQIPTQGRLFQERID